MPDSERTRWGGIVDSRCRATGYFRAERVDGVWWLVDPDGGRYLSKAVTTVRFEQDRIQNTTRSPYGEACQRKYGGREAWQRAAADRLAGWGFNSLGAWSEDAVARAGARPLAIAPIVDLGAAFVSERAHGSQAWLHGIFPDVFDPQFPGFARARAETRCAARRDDPSIIGWFSDNELRWGPDWRGTDELLTMFLNAASESPGRLGAIAMLRGRYADFPAFDDVWATGAGSWEAFGRCERVQAPFVREALWAQNQEIEREKNIADPRRGAFVGDCEAFVGELATRYFEATTNALRAADPNHLVLGCRFAYVPQRPVIDAAGRFLDVIAFNCYAPDPLHAIDAYAVTGKPCLLGEFAFRGDDAGLPNTRGAGPRVPTQADRATSFERYLTAGLGTPELVGYHWFEHADEPKEGRFDGENSNYGVVSIEDEPYVELVTAMTALNQRAEAIHAQAVRTS